MLDDFLVRAVLGGIGVAALAGPLGCFVVWRRMAFFGHALAHSALLGIALGALLAVDLNLATVAICLVFAIALVLLQRQPALSTDTILGILAHVALALGLVALSFLEWLRVDLMAYLFGDVLAVTRADLIWIWGGGAVALAALVWLWPALLCITVNEELAQAEGVEVGRVQLGFVLVMALAVAIGMKIVGILLIVSLLVIPPAAARHLARTPEQMAALAALIGVLSVIFGVGGSLRWDTPAGPTIVLASAALFLLAMALGPMLRPARPAPSPRARDPGQGSSPAA
ncbi:MAG TPA: metal ABC transporter permease [Geminicoccaceae bacterium]|nr:metal ABC transporter permease [Geminicoccaceae bacterium]